MQTNQIGYVSLTIRTVVVHTVTYFLAGLLALVLLHYDQLFAGPELATYMRPTDDIWVFAGPLFQPIRGLVFASVFYLLREPLFGQRRGWLVMWWVLLAIGILSTFGPAPGSIEGMIYTRIPIRTQLVGLPEGVLQSLLLSVLLFVWVRHPEKRWLGWLLGALFAIVVVLATLGLMTHQVPPS